MSDSFTLPLRPPKKNTPKKDDLPLRIAQINAQRGGFRNVTEDDLVAEIAAIRAAGRNPNDPEEGVSARKEDEANRQEELFKSRAEILDFAMSVYYPGNVYSNADGYSPGKPTLKLRLHSTSSPSLPPSTTRASRNPPCRRTSSPRRPSGPWAST